MNLVLDSSVLIDLQRGNNETLKKIDELRKSYPAPPAISFVVLVEFLYGLKDKSFKNEEKSKLFLQQFEVLHTTDKTADIIVDLQKKYELPLADIFIAAQTIEQNSLLVTKDKDFGIIEEIDKIII